MKILITNPPWIIYRGFTKRIGVRAGSRWPFTGEVHGSKLVYILKTLTTTPPWTIGKKIFYKLRSDSRLFPDTNSIRPYTPYPVFMGYATSYLQSKGVGAKFYDAIGCGDDYKAFFKKVDSFKPDIIVQETSTPSFDVDLRIARKLHKKYEVCLVGSHATAFAERLIKLPFVDYILKGEYEYSALEMVQTRRKGVYDFNRVKNLDDLPYPYRDDEIIHYYNEPCCKKDLDYPQLWIYGSRGCAFHCDFCLWVHTMYSKRFSLRSPIKILDEVENMVTKYGFRYILFDDDCWNLGPPERLMEIADGLHRIGLPWSILGRLDTCSKDVFKYFVDRGCVGLRLGVESLSQPLLDRTHKGLKVETIMNVLNYLKTLDVSLYLCFMHYLPGETEAERKEHSRRIKELAVRYQNPPCIPFPGTPYYEELVKGGLDPEKKVRWREYDGGNIGSNLLKIVRRYSEKFSQEATG